MVWAVLAGGRAWADDETVLAEKPPVAAPPGWVRKIDAAAVDLKNTQLDYLLIDRQLRVEDQTSSLYSHFVMHLGNQAAVDDESHVQIDYSPATQRIVLHSLALRRGGQSIDQLSRARISTLRRERDLERGIIDGELTASIVLEDVRVGDIVDYSYTLVTGADGLDTPFSETFTTQWLTPVRYSHLRVIYPDARALAIKTSNPADQPTSRVAETWRELVWEWHDLAALPREDDRPGWYVHYPYIYLSEARSWPEIARWATRLYPKARLSAELKSLIAQLQTSGEKKEQLIVAALRFVQDEIRYTGIEIGAGGYKPQPPDVVLKRRFGDCKEKSYLLVTLLQALGIEARPALVNTYRRQATPDLLLPSAAAFDHMIVRVQHEGKVYWLDSTRTLQGGGLYNLQQAHFGAALVVDDSGTFETIPEPILNTPNESIVERFDLKAGVFAKASMRVETTYLGAEADRMRGWLARTSKDEVTRQYLNFYKDDYPNVDVAEPFVVVDDREANQVVVIEKYLLDPAFVADDEDGEDHYFEINPNAIWLAARAPKTVVRTSPLQLDHPTNVRYKAVVLLPEPWPIEDSHNSIATKAFTYRSAVRYQHNTVTAEYEFKTQLNDIPAAEVAEHGRKLEAVRHDASYSLSYSTAAAAAPEPFELSFAMTFALIGGIVGGGLIMRWLWRYQDPRYPKPATSPHAHVLEGVGGWLVLPTLGLFASVISLARVLYSWRSYFDAALWAALGSGQDAVIAHWGKIGVFFVLMLGVALQLITIFLLYLLFTKRRGFAPGYLGLIWIELLWSVLNRLSLSAVGMSTAAPRVIGLFVALELIGTLIWTAYMLRSERVRVTFVRTRSGPPTVTPGSAETSDSPEARTAEQAC
jgi:transglutaminase-like putative cysteine protease